MKNYPFFPERLSQCLNGAWEFKWLGADAEIENIQPALLHYDELTAVPGVFDTSIDRFGKRGTGVYRRKIIIDAVPKRLLRLKTGGLGLYAKIWWDGKNIGECKLPYSSVDYDFPAGQGSEHELVIAVDNRFDMIRSPLFSPYFDFYAYGGIYRGLELQLLPECRIERVQVITTDIKTGKINLSLKLGGNIQKQTEFKIRFDNGTAIEKFTRQTTDGTITLEMPVPDFKLWSPESPHLHTVNVSIDGDRVVERFGIRTVETCGQKILLNGKPLRLLGVNRHEAHPEFGPVQNTHLMLDDLRLIKDLGCNFIRCVHYPQDQEFLDLCDELGILVWQESMGWNNAEDSALDPQFFELQIQQTRLMITNSINHPSVIIWGFLNECCSDTQGGRKLYEALYQTIKDVDPSLLVSYASNRVENDICFDLCDIGSINIYPGWCSPSPDFTTPISSLIAARVEKCARFADTAALKDKPFLMTEIGACALYGFHDRANAQWSEEFQADYFATALDCILGNPRYAGIALWQFCDTRSYVNAGQVRNKPRGFNGAGLLDEYRRPKIAYDTVKAIYHRQSGQS